MLGRILGARRIGKNKYTSSCITSLEYTMREVGVALGACMPPFRMLPITRTNHRDYGED